MKSLICRTIGVLIGVIVCIILYFNIPMENSKINDSPVVQKYSVGQIIKMKIDCRKCQILYPGFFSGWVVRCVSLNTKSNYTEINVSEIEMEEIE